MCSRLMLMALYNVSISVRGLKYISQSPGLLPMVWTLLEGEDYCYYYYYYYYYY